MLKYDEVMNGQREAIYGERRKILEGQDLREESIGFVEDLVADVVESADARPTSSPRNGISTALQTALLEIYPAQVTEDQAPQASSTEELVRPVRRPTRWRGTRRRSRRSRPRSMRELERVVLLNITDTKWREHLYEMDYLQEGIHLRALAQTGSDHRVSARGLRHVPGADRVDPGGLRALHLPGRVRAQGEEQPQRQAPQPSRGARQPQPRSRRRAGSGPRVAGGGPARANANQAVSDKVPRNAPCPCGSGKKYKKCHGATV